MRVKVGFCVATAMFLLAGCQKAATNNSVGGNATADSNVATTAESNVVTRDWLVGRWISTDGACADAIEYKADGSFPALSGATWSLNGTQLTVNIPDTEPQVKTVTRTGPDGMRQALVSGSFTDFTRCH